MKLEDIRFKTRCDVPWDDMTGDENSRLCSRCDKQVFNLSAMTRQEAESLIANEVGEAACLRLHHRPDGTVTTADCKPAAPPPPPHHHTSGVPRKAPLS